MHPYQSLFANFAFEAALRVLKLAFMNPLTVRAKLPGVAVSLPAGQVWRGLTLATGQYPS